MFFGGHTEEKGLIQPTNKNHQGGTRDVGGIWDCGKHMGLWDSYGIEGCTEDVRGTGDARGTGNYDRHRGL